MRLWYNWALYKRPLYSYWYEYDENKPNKNKSFCISKSVIRCNTVNVDQRMHVELWDRDSYLISTIFYFKSDDVIEEEVFFTILLFCQCSKFVLHIMCIINIMLYDVRPIRMFDSWEKSCQKMQLIIKNSSGQRCSFSNLPLSFLR